MCLCVGMYVCLFNTYYSIFIHISCNGMIKAFKQKFINALKARLDSSELDIKMDTMRTLGVLADRGNPETEDLIKQILSVTITNEDVSIACCCVCVNCVCVYAFMCFCICVYMCLCIVCVCDCVCVYVCLYVCCVRGAQMLKCDGCPVGSQQLKFGCPSSSLGSLGYPHIS